MGLPKDRRLSTHSEDNNDTWEVPTEGKDRTKGGTRMAREGQNPANNWSDRGPNWRAYAVDKKGATRSGTVFGRTDRARRRERRGWWIGWS